MQRACRSRLGMYLHCIAFLVLSSIMHLHVSFLRFYQGHVKLTACQSFVECFLKLLHCGVKGLSVLQGL